MRLQRLYLREFKNLRDFTIYFADRLTTVLVGPNGTGKSNVLEALIIIFRDLDLGDHTCNGGTVFVDADPARHRGSIRIKVDGAIVPPSRFARKGGGKHLPGYIFGYCSGPTNRMESHFETHQKML